MHPLQIHIHHSFTCQMEYIKSKERVLGECLGIVLNFQMLKSALSRYLLRLQGTWYMNSGKCPVINISYQPKYCILYYLGKINTFVVVCLCVCLELFMSPTSVIFKLSFLLFHLNLEIWQYIMNLQDIVDEFSKLIFYMSM